MGYFPYYEPTRRLPAKGIPAKSQRGRIGETWWSHRFVEVLESFNMGARLTRGRSYARSGQVLDLSVDSGVATASVQGSRPRPYKVSIHLKPLSERQWQRLEKAMAERALLLAKLLAGEMPPEIEKVFERCGLSLFPASRRALVTDCSCPDWENPCKHLAAAFYILAERFDADPFLIFVWRGRTKEELIQRLRVRRVGPKIRKGGDGAATTRAAPPLRECLGNFWDMAADISDLHTNPRAVATPAALLDELAMLPEEAGGHAFGQTLREAYQKIAARAEERAWSG